MLRSTSWHECHTASNDLVLTTTLEPCLQCAAAIRLAGIKTVRFAGADRIWEGCHDFARLSAREASRRQPERDGPRDDEIGLFATLISRIGPAVDGSGVSLSPELGVKFAHAAESHREVDASLHVLARAHIAPDGVRGATVLLGWNLL